MRKPAGDASLTAAPAADLAAANIPTLEIISRRVIFRSSFPRSNGIPMRRPVQEVFEDARVI
jgi:hypothetical protein